MQPHWGLRSTVGMTTKLNLPRYTCIDIETNEMLFQDVLGAGWRGRLLNVDPPHLTPEPLGSTSRFHTQHSPESPQEYTVFLPAYKQLKQGDAGSEYFQRRGPRGAKSGPWHDSLN